MFVDKAIALILLLNCCSLGQFQSTKPPGEFTNYVTIRNFFEDLGRLLNGDYL